MPDLQISDMPSEDRQKQHRFVKRGYGTNKIERHNLNVQSC